MNLNPAAVDVTTAYIPAKPDSASKLNPNKNKL